MHSEEALWTFDIPTRTWRHREAFGDLLGPHLAIAMTVSKDQVFLLCNSPEDTDPAELYVLDLDTFTWPVLRPHGAPECFLANSSAVRVQVQLILSLPHLYMDRHLKLLSASSAAVHSGQYIVPYNELLGHLPISCSEYKVHCCLPLATAKATCCCMLQDQWVIYEGTKLPSNLCSNDLHVLDLNTLTWSKPEVAGTPLKHRQLHMATCYNDMMIVMGGENHSNPLCCSLTLLPAQTACQCTLSTAPCATERPRKEICPAVFCHHHMFLSTIHWLAG